MSTIIQSIEQAQLREVPVFKAGDTVRVHFKVIEGSRQRVQVFEGVVIKRQGSGVRETFTVRKQSFGVGVERTFPLHSPKIERIEVVSRGDVRRAKLYYLRGRVGRRARVRERQFTGSIAAGAAPGAVGAQPVPEDEAGPRTEGDVAPGGEAPAEASGDDTGTEAADAPAGAGRAAGAAGEPDAADEAEAGAEPETGGEAEAADASAPDQGTAAEPGSSEGEPGGDAQAAEGDESDATESR